LKVVESDEKIPIETFTDCSSSTVQKNRASGQAQGTIGTPIKKSKKVTCR